MLGAETVPSDTVFSVAEVRKALKLVGTLAPPRTSDLLVFEVLMATTVKAPMVGCAKATTKRFGSVVVTRSIRAPGRM
jgi:hypothetical protein